MKAKVRILIFIVICGFLLALSKSFLSNANSHKIKRERDLYLPELKYLKLISLGHDALISDLLLAWALLYSDSHFDQGIGVKSKNLKKLIFSAVEMDSKNSDAFLMGNNLLKSLSVNDSIDLLKRGRFYHPELWKLPEMIGLNYFYYLKNSYLAEKYFEMASQMPNHPPYYPSISGESYEEAGRHRYVLRILYNFYSSTEDEKLKESFKHSIAEVREKIRERTRLLNGRITKIIDGDSFEFEPDRNNPQYGFLKSIEGIRLVGINSHEMTDENEKNRLFAHIQKDFAFFAIGTRNVSIEFERASNGSLKRDKYNRLLGFMFLEDKKMYQLLALENGMVRGFYKFPFKKEYKYRFHEAEKRAKESKRGLYRFPPEEIRLSKIDSYVGKIVALRFRVYKVFFGTRDVFLDSGTDYRNVFSAIIPLRYAGNFSKKNYKNYFRKLQGKWIKVTGFLGFYKNKSQMRLYFPSQLKLFE